MVTRIFEGYSTIAPVCTEYIQLGSSEQASVLDGKQYDKPLPLIDMCTRRITVRKLYSIQILELGADHTQCMCLFAQLSRSLTTFQKMTAILTICPLDLPQISNTKNERTVTR